jgi:hypothetical protein
MTTLSIHRSAASELFIPFNTRYDAYLWGIRFIQHWGNDFQISPYEKNDSSIWGSPVAVDTYFEIFIFSGKTLYNRSTDWYESKDLGFHEVDKEYAFHLGLRSEPCICEDPCAH